jgi:hypothetical protein
VRGRSAEGLDGPTQRLASDPLLSSLMEPPALL